jgi:hypothetical protein
MNYVNQDYMHVNYTLIPAANQNTSRFCLDMAQ